MYNAPYYSPYTPGISQQNMAERIDNQIHQLQQMKEQLKTNNQQPSINQTFQLAPNQGGIKYVNSIDDVNKENVFVDTAFFSKDLSVLWIKNSAGDIKAYELEEIVKKDEKDLQIEYLTAKINELEGMITNEQPITNAIEQQVTASTSTNDETVRKPIEKDKPAGVSRISKSKAK